MRSNVLYKLSNKVTNKQTNKLNKLVWMAIILFADSFVIGDNNKTILQNAKVSFL